jgi:hypothetical protein
LQTNKSAGRCDKRGSTFISKLPAEDALVFAHAAAPRRFRNIRQLSSRVALDISSRVDRVIRGKGRPADSPLSMADDSEHAAAPGFKFPPKEDLLRVVGDLNRPIAQRMRAIFYLRTLGGEDAVQALCKGATSKRMAAAMAAWRC